MRCPTSTRRSRRRSTGGTTSRARRTTSRTRRRTSTFLGNQRLPDVRLEASYRGSGLGGTQFLRTGAFPGIVTGTRNRGFGDALGQAFTPDYPTWSVGVTVSYPLGHSYEEAQPRARGSRAAAGGAAHREPAARGGRVRSPGGASGAKHRPSAWTPRAPGATLAEQRLADEQRRYDVGLSTTFLVTQAQRDLLQAQVNLLQATLDHQSAVVNFEAVQQAPPAGSRERPAGATPTSSCCRRRRRAASSARARDSERHRGGF